MVSPEKISGRLGNKMFQIAYLYSQMKDGNIPDMFVQNPKFFEKYENEVKAMFSEGIGYVPHIAIHIRRGANPINPDEPKYCDNPFYVDLTKTDYYEKAIENFKESTFIVFSDDTDFAKEMFPDREKFQIAEGQTELEDFNMMASCSSQIIANSSFSYWAAFLNPNPGKIVIAPSKEHWYADGIERTVCPTSWIRM